MMGKNSGQWPGSRRGLTPSPLLAALYQALSVAVDLDAWQQHRSARSSSRIMGQLPRQANPPQSEWGSPEKSPKAASAGGLL